MFRPIETPIGIFRGRDAIYLDSLEYELHGLLRLTGGFNRRLASKRADSFANYILTFSGVLAFKVIEIDSWDYECDSSFDEIVDSDWCKTLGGKITPSHKHYQIQTYDYVIEVVADKFSLKIDAD